MFAWFKDVHDWFLACFLLGKDVSWANVPFLYGAFNGRVPGAKTGLRLRLIIAAMRVVRYVYVGVGKQSCSTLDVSGRLDSSDFDWIGKCWGEKYLGRGRHVGLSVGASGDSIASSTTLVPICRKGNALV